MNKQKEIQKLKEDLNKFNKRLEELEKKETFEECSELMWSDTQTEGNWHEAMKFADDCIDGGYADWRLPTVSELQDVFDYETGEPKVGGFSDEYFWSSTGLSCNPTYAWRVYLVYGRTHFNTKVTDTYYVRCVRRV